MKKTLFLLLLVISLGVVGQEFNEQLIVPLTSPSERGKLEVGLVRGDISVVAYEGDEVIIEATSANNDCDDCDEDHDCDDCDEDEDDNGRDLPSGMTRISSNPLELAASERNNKVEIETNSWKRGINLEIRIPKAFDLDVSSVHGKVTVEGVDGSMEVSTVHGPLTFTDISGSLICNTVHGDVIANFDEVTPDEPMSFVTLHGDVDITFPENIEATAKMKSDRGEIFTDFDMEIDRSRPEVKSQERGEYRVSINSWVFGEINGGGPEYTFKNMHGDIIIRKD